MTFKKNTPLKSVVEESSSVAKAVEKAWSRTGKPAEFSVKIFQIEEKNFFGMSTKPAKIGLFFKDALSQSPKDTERFEKRESTREHKQTQRPASSEKPARVRPLSRETTPSESTREQQRSKSHAQPSSHSGAQWSPEMIQLVRSWLEQTLRLLNKNATTFSLQPSNLHLKIVFAQELFGDQEKERTFFRVTSYLLMQSLRTFSKEGFRGFKIIMASSTHNA
jgi:hypothetical protein